MELKTFNKNPYNQNSYVYFNPQTKEGIIIDPGLSKSQLIKAAEGLDIKALLLTHGHFDHIYSLDKVRKITGALAYCHKNEYELIKTPALNMSAVSKEMSTSPDVLLEDKQILNFMGLDFEVIFTPGHTGGGVCYFDKTNNVIFSGDTLFKGSVGRTDLPTGDLDTLIISIKSRLFTLDENIVLYPGHGKSTTIGEEKKFNPFVN